MEGLEISEIEFKKFIIDKEKRLESEYWNSRNSIKIETYKGEEIIDFVQYGTSDELNENKSGFPVLRLNEFDSYFIGIPQKYCNIITRSEFENYRLLKDDVLVCRTNGNPQLVGRAAIVQENTNFAYASYLFKIRPKNELINSAALVAFLRSKYGRNEINAYSMQGNQTNFSPAKFREISIPKFSMIFNKKIKDTFDFSHKSLSISRSLYTQAEALLLETLGLKDFEPSSEAVNIKSFKDSFGTSGRLDAEYYQKKYEEVEEILKINGFHLISDISELINYGTVPTSPYTEDSTGIPYIKGMNLKNTFISKEKLDKIINTEELPLKYFTQKGDIIISQMGTVGDIGVVTDEIGWLFASFTIRIRLKQKSGYNPHFLGLYIQNIAKPYYLYRNIAQASVRQNTDLPTIKNMYVPIVPLPIQSQIASLVEASFRFKQESEELLETAKRAVEIAIEENEETAIKYINQCT